MGARPIGSARALWVVSVGILMSGVGTTTAEAQATTAVDRILDQVGGREVWAQARGFHMVEILHSAGLPLPAVREYWVDFERPRILERTVTNSIVQLQALNEGSGWRLRDGELTEWTMEAVSDWAGFWPGIPTRVFHLMASNDPSLRVESVEGNRMNVFVDGSFAVWIATNDAGIPVAYGREESHTATHFLGRMEEYGPVRLWATAYEPGDAWRVTMVDYDLFHGDLPVSYQAPVESATHRPTRTRGARDDA